MTATESAVIGTLMTAPLPMPVSVSKKYSAALKFVCAFDAKNKNAKKQAVAILFVLCRMVEAIVFILWLVTTAFVKKYQRNRKQHERMCTNMR